MQTRRTNKYRLLLVSIWLHLFKLGYSFEDSTNVNQTRKETREMKSEDKEAGTLPLNFSAATVAQKIFSKKMLFIRISILCVLCYT